MADIYLRSEAARLVPFRLVPSSELPYSVVRLGATRSHEFGPDSVPLYLISRAFTVARAQRSLRTWIRLSFIADSTPARPSCTLGHSPASLARFSSVVAQRVRVYFYSCVCWWNQIFIPRVLSARAVVSLVSADIRDDVTLAWILFMWQPMGFAERHVQRGVKRRDDTSAAAAASHLFCKRAFGVSELRPDKDGELCCEYTRAVSTRVGWNVRINRSAVFVRGTLVSPFT